VRCDLGCVVIGITILSAAFHEVLMVGELTAEDAWSATRSALASEEDA